MLLGFFKFLYFSTSKILFDNEFTRINHKTAENKKINILIMKSKSKLKYTMN